MPFGIASIAFSFPKCQQLHFHLSLNAWAYLRLPILVDNRWFFWWVDRYSWTDSPKINRFYNEYATIRFVLLCIIVMTALDVLKLVSGVPLEEISEWFDATLSGGLACVPDAAWGWRRKFSVKWSKSNRLRLLKTRQYYFPYCLHCLVDGFSAPRE